MEARIWFNKHGEPALKRLVVALRGLSSSGPGRPKTCSAGYFRQIAYGYRRPSFELAEDLVAASVLVSEHHQGDVLDVTSLLRAKELHAERQAAATADPVEEAGHVAP